MISQFAPVHSLFKFGSRLKQECFGQLKLSGVNQTVDGSDGARDLYWDVGKLDAERRGETLGNSCFK